MWWSTRSTGSTRSLADFARLVEIFERHKVSFVSVTQQFNTTTSMGRLMLNILLSFAQFEREVTGERIRDKIAASKRKGMWMGGYPALGYDVKDRQLVINEAEAATVRRIFERFAELRSATDLCRELALDGITTKAWKTADGRVRNGTPMDKKFVAKALRNPIYVGEIRHKGVVHAGQHEPIITRQLWDRVQAILDEDAHARMGATRTRGKTDALLRGLLYGANGEKYHITFSTKPSGKKYRYYIPKADRRYGRGTSATGMIPADQIEEVVVNLVVSALQAPEAIQGTWNQVRLLYPEIEEPTVILAMRRLGDVWKQLFPEEQVRLVNLLVVAPAGIDDPVTINATEAALPPSQDPTLLRVLARGFYWQHLLDTGVVEEAAEIAEREGLHRVTVNDGLKFALLAPELVQAALDGSLPRTMSLELLQRRSISVDWEEQQEMVEGLG